VSSDGKEYKVDCANTEGIFRIIQSIPSPKAEPFKRWLAKVGYERVQEIEDPTANPSLLENCKPEPARVCRMSSEPEAPEFAGRARVLSF